MEELTYACGHICQEHDWVSLDGRIGYIQGDGWRMCMGTGFECVEDSDLWVAYVMFRGQDDLWQYEVTPLHDLTFVCNKRYIRI